MTVQTNTNVASFNGNGVTQIFPIAFKFNNDTDLIVLLVDDATGAVSQLTLNSDYTVSGEGDEEGGLINVVVAPALGQRLKVTRVVDIRQLTDLRNQGKFFAEVHEDAFDLLTMIAQQHESGIKSALRVAESDPEPARIPAVAQRAGKLLAFNQDGDPTTVAPVSDSSTELRLELANGTPHLVDGEVVWRADRHIDSVAALAGLSGRYAGDTLQTASYYSGWAAQLAGPVGGATFVWDATRPKSQHNGGNIISPTVPWDGAEANLAAYIAKTGETDPAGAGCWVHKNLRGNEYNVLQWGAKNDATTNGANDAMIQPLLDYIEAPVGGGYGGIVNFPRGNYRFSIYFNVRDRTTLRGEGTSATILQFLGTSVGNCITLGPTGPNHPLNPNGHWVFGVRLECLAVSGGNSYKGLDRALIYTDGAHEHSGLFNVVLRDFVNFGVHYATGNGGPALFEVSDVEIYGSDTAPTAGTKRGISCNAGGALILVRHATITGGDTNKLAQGIAMFKDNLIAQGVHFENATSGISLSQTDAASPRVNVISGVTGNSTVGTSGLVDIASGFEGSVSAHGLINKSLSTTGLITLINRKTGESFTDQALAAYMYPSAVSQGESVSHGRINVASGVASIVKQQGRAFTVSQTAAGVTQITLSSAMPDTNYTVTPTARLSGGGACFVEFSPISTTVFEIRVRSSAGALIDPASVWFSLEI